MWEELLGEVVVREGIDFEGQIEILFGGVEDCFAAGDAGIADENGGVAEGATDLGGRVFDGGG